MKIFWQARHAYPLECCGVLLGDPAGVVQEAVPCANVAQNTRAGYRIDPAELIRIQRESRARGMAIIGFYHSHPEASAAPSAADSEQAFWTGCSYVIASVRRGEVQEVRSFRLGMHGSLEEEPLVVSAPAGL